MWLTVCSAVTMFPNTSTFLTVSSPGSLHVSRVHSVQQPLPAEQALTTGGVVTLHSVHMEPAELQQVLLGVGDEAETVEEALSVGQVCCGLPAGIP